MKNISFCMQEYPLKDIIKDYYLNNLCVNDTPQMNNIAATIQSLYFYHDLIVSNCLPKYLETSICRTMIIMSYGVLEGIIVSLSYKIQTACYYCSRRCNFYSRTIFQSDNSKQNERNAFNNADRHLSDIHILSLSNKERIFYDEFRDVRNNIHLARNTETITANSRYTRKYCAEAIKFLQQLVKNLNNNYVNFIERHYCEL